MSGPVVTGTPTTAAPATVDIGPVRRRTLAVLAGSQVMGAFGTVTGISVGVLLAATLAGTAVSGLAQSVVVVGQGLLALPISLIGISRRCGSPPRALRPSFRS